MKIENTAPGGRGFTAGGKTIEIEGGATADVPGAVVAAGKQDPIVAGWFTDGTFVEVVKPVAAKVEPEGKPAK